MSRNAATTPNYNQAYESVSFRNLRAACMVYPTAGNSPYSTKLKTQPLTIYHSILADTCAHHTVLDWSVCTCLTQLYDGRDM